MAIEFDVAAFRIQFPEFSDDTEYPDAVLQMNFAEGTCYVSDGDYGVLSGTCRVLALNLMTAHLTKLNTEANSGDDNVQVVSSNIDKVSVTTTPPPNKDQFQWWLNLTAYGKRLASLLDAKSVGGFYIGGSNEIGAFRKAGGRF